jgi:hypothetical protein
LQIIYNNHDEPKVLFIEHNLFPVIQDLAEDVSQVVIKEIALQLLESCAKLLMGEIEEDEEE